MTPELGRRPMHRGNKESSFGDDYEKEIGVLLGEQQRRQEEADELERELNLYRSGSAPPTVDGSVSAAGGLFSGGGGAPFLEFGGVNKGNGFPNKSDQAYKATDSWRNSQLRRSQGSAYNGGGGLANPYQQLDSPAASALGFSGMDTRLHGGGYLNGERT